MILKVCGKIPSDEILKITVCNETKEIYGIEPQVIFNVKEKGKYQVEIEQPLSKSNRRPISMLFYFLTVILQGIFNVIFLNTDSKWYNNIKAYCLKASMVIDIQQDTELHFTYANSKYNKDTGKWEKPVFTTDLRENLSIDYIANMNDFKNQYFNYVKKVISVAAVLILVLLILLNAVIGKVNVGAILFVIALLLGAIVLTVALSILEYKRFVKIQKNFIRHMDV